jgi:hypothetical protein
MRVAAVLVLGLACSLAQIFVPELVLLAPNLIFGKE